MELTTGRVKYSQTSCYLCSEWLDDNDVEKHLRHCRQQQIECPNRCGAIVAKKDIRLHTNTCPAGYGQYGTMETGNSSVANAYEHELTWTDTIHGMETGIKEIKETVAQFITKHAGMEAQLEQYSKQCAAQKNLFMGIYEILLDYTTNDSRDRRAMQRELAEMQHKLSRLSVNLNADDAEGAVAAPNAATTVESANGEATSAEERIAKLEALVKHLYAAGNGNEKEQSNTEAKADEKKPVEDDVESSLELLEEVNPDPNTEERITQLAQKVDRYRHEAYYTKQLLDDVRNHMKVAEYRKSLASEDGRILWRIDKFAERMEQSKENQVMVRSPIFTNKPYGYTLQLEVGWKWYDNHMTVGLVVLPGPYDTLLHWPAQLSGNLVLHDQVQCPSMRRNLRSKITAHHKDCDKRVKSHIPIAHKSLYSGQYILNDCIFFECIIEN
uniref:MATH domain-containing protein n=1 Tax=Anopheles minimus TaxID=112268 RepID=A0A182W5N8_9DIPT